MLAGGYIGKVCREEGGRALDVLVCEMYRIPVALSQNQHSVPLGSSPSPNTHTHTHTVASVRDREFSSKINHYVSYSGFTPLHYAVVMEEEGGEMVRYLLDHGADPTTENNRGFCPIKYSTKEETRKLLQEYASQVIICLFASVQFCWSHSHVAPTSSL